MDTKLDLLRQLRDDFWDAAFTLAVQQKLIRDGVYQPDSDRDIILTFCGDAV